MQDLGRGRVGGARVGVNPLRIDACARMRVSGFLTVDRRDATGTQFIGISKEALGTTRGHPHRRSFGESAGAVSASPPAQDGRRALPWRLLCPRARVASLFPPGKPYAASRLRWEPRTGSRPKRAGEGAGRFAHRLSGPLGHQAFGSGTTPGIPCSGACRRSRAVGHASVIETKRSERATTSRSDDSARNRILRSLVGVRRAP